VDIHFNPNLPIYLQIIDGIKNLIVSNEWEAGFRIPSVRDLAQTFSVNPNTVQRALSELERDGFLYSERTSGRFVTQNTGRIEAARDGMTDEFVYAFVDKLLEMGYSGEELLKRVEQAVEKRTAGGQHD